MFDILLGNDEPRRVYLAIKLHNIPNSELQQSELLGVFTNRKILLGALTQVGIPNNAYIKGMRSNKTVSVSSIANGFFDRVLNIYYNDDNNNPTLLFKVWELTLNRLNPKHI